ncbi:MAG: ankyrin repeat domain-containing protein [Vicinamibacterales bacterium]
MRLLQLKTKLVSMAVLPAAVLGFVALTQGPVLSAAADLRLLEAVQRQDQEAVRTLLKQGVDVNARRGDGANALARAVHLDNVKIVDLLVAAGANVNAANDLGITPLMLASTNGNAAVVERLLKAKADPNFARTTGETAMMYAARTGQTSVIKLLLTAGAVADRPAGDRGQTPLMWAAAEGHAEAAKLLLEVGAKADTVTKSKPFVAGNAHYLSDRKPLERLDKTRSVITVLWPKDGDGDMDRFEGGMTPLLFAIDRGQLEVVRVLLEGGANVNAPTPNGWTPLQFAMIRRNEAMALFLLEHGADAKNAGPGVPPLHITTYLGQPAVAKALLAHGVDPNARLMKPYRLIEVLEIGVNLYPGSGLFTNIGSTPFMTAAKHGQVEIMRMLLAAGADPFLTARGGETALMLAGGVGRPQPTNVTYHVWKETEQIEALKICLELGLDINAQNQWAQTALHGASFHDDARVVTFLAEKGAWLDAPDWQDQTPLRVAQGHEICCSSYHVKLLAAAALIKAGANPKAGQSLKFAAHDFENDQSATQSSSQR